jgi:hypothetical protein
MGLLENSVLVNRISNKVGDEVFYASRGRQAVRAYVESPAFPNSGPQQAINDIFKALLPKWYGTLSDAQRQGWNQYASISQTASKAEKRVSSQGVIPYRSKYQTGYNAFMGLNTRLIYLGGAEIDDAPLGFRAPRTPIDLLATIATIPPVTGYSVVMADAANNGIITPAFALNSAGNALAVQIWPYITNWGGNYQVFFAHNIRTNAETFLLWKGAATNNIDFEYSTGSSRLTVTWANALLNKYGAKRHLFLIVDYAGATAELFLDNVSLGVKALTTPTFPASSATKSFACWANGTYTVAGHHDELAIWNTLKDADFVDECWNGGTGLYLQDSADLEIGHHCDEGAGTGAILDDISSNNRTSTIGSANSWTDGLVPKPAVPAIDLDWTNPSDAKAGDKINVWGVVEDLSKPQLIISLAYPANSYTVLDMRGKLGASIGMPAGCYHFQVAIMEAHGIQSVGSNISGVVLT